MTNIDGAQSALQKDTLLQKTLKRDLIAIENMSSRTEN